MGLKVILSLKGGNVKKYNLGDFVFGAILFAIIVLMAFVPSVGYIPIIPGVAYATLLHIPVLIGAIFLGWKWGLALGLTFGISSMTQAFLIMGPANAPFTNPIVSVLPRVLIGVLAPFMHSWLTKAFKGRDKLALFFTFGIMTIIHTVTVLTILYPIIETGWYYTKTTEDVASITLKAILLSIVSINSLAEIVLAVLIGPAIYLPLDQLRKKKNHKLEEEV